MIELLRRAAAINPDGPAVVVPNREVTYADLLGAAERVAATLQNRAITRFGIASFDAEHVLVMLGAASLIGAQACILPPVPLGENLQTAQRLEIPVVLVDEIPNDGSMPEIGHNAEILSYTELHHTASSAGVAATPPERRPHLVLTTGSTGTPKAIKYDWQNLTKLPRTVTPDHSTMNQRWLLAYGLHQFGGLQILLTVTASAATLVAPTPRRPREGLSAMRAFEVTHASATPTYWRFLLAELRAADGPAPALRQITMGGEATSPDLLDAVRATFPTARITQVYAASEFGAINVSDGLAGLPVSLLDSGTDADITVKIVDGELWVRSKVGMDGVHGQASPHVDGWHPTGDLVELVDGRIRFRGRTTEVINVGGVKVHPLPVEERVTATTGVQAARVFGRANPVTGMVVAIELVISAGHDDREVVDTVRDACRDLPPASQPRSIRVVPQLETVGGKLTRRVHVS